MEAAAVTQNWLHSFVAFAAAATLVACSGAGPEVAPSPDEASQVGNASGSSTSAFASVPAPGPEATAALAFLSTLDDKQRSDAAFAFNDPERRKWSYVPQERAGLPLKAMDAEQRAAAFEVVGTGLSERGTRLAREIVALEGTLQALERAAGSPWAARRDPGLYYLALFGRPGGTQAWAWRFEGHHLSLNVTDLGPHGQIVAPLFMGANPARVPSGPQQGLRLLAAEEDLAFDLLHSLDPRQRARAIIAPSTFGDIRTRNDPVVRAMEFAGLPLAEMTLSQQQRLRRLLELYAGRMAETATSQQLQRIELEGFERLHFAWAGSQQPGKPHYYRIHGPTVLVEYDNSQGDANHIHTVWRDLENDFGGDLLRKHYAGQPHGR